MFLTKYSPATTKEITGNVNAINDMRRWLASWRSGQALLLHGPTGTGKTTAVRLLAKESGHELLEIHPDEKIPVSEIRSASSQRSIFSKKKIILIENIETASMRGFSDILKQSEHPLICTTLDAYKINPATRKMLRLIKFDKASEAELTSLAKRVCESEGAVIDDRKIGQLARMANGDVRSMLIDLETAVLGIDPRHIGYRNFEENVFNTIRLIFKTMSIENTKIAVENCEKDSEELFLWLEQNIQEEYDTAAIAKAYDYLSKADIFGTRIMRRQSWSLGRYASDIMVYGTALAKTKPNPRSVIYRPPFFRRTSRSALRKIAAGLHTSTANAHSYIPLIKMHPVVCEKLGMDERETDSITG